MDPPSLPDLSSSLPASRRNSESGVLSAQNGLRNKRVRDDIIDGSALDDLEDESGNSVNPFDVICNWPKLGKGNHSGAAKRQHEWFRILTSAICDLRKGNEYLSKKVLSLEKSVFDKSNLIIELDLKIKTLEGEIANIERGAVSESAPKLTYADLTSGKKSTESENVLLAKVQLEMRKKEKIVRNIIVKGLDEELNDNEKKKEEEKVGKLMKALELEGAKVRRSVRLRKEGSRPDLERPTLLLVEFEDPLVAEKAVHNARKLSRSQEFRKVYISRDRTHAERETDAALRKTRNEMNSRLPYVKDESKNLRYGVDEVSGRHFYWAIRDSKLEKVTLREIARDRNERN